MYRKNRRKQPINPYWIVGITGSLLFIFVLSLSTSYQSFQQNAENISKLASKKKALTNTYANLKPKSTAITRGEFDLQKHQFELDSTYSTLLKYAFGTIRSSKDLSKHSDLYIKYFGKQGYDKIKLLSLDEQNNPVASRNISTRVSFSDFDSSSMTEKITIYSVFDLTTKMGGKTQAIVSASGIYDYTDHTGSDFSIQFSTLN